MKTCPNCRNQVADDAGFCPICGTAIGVAPQFPSQETKAYSYEPATDFGQLPMDAPTVPFIDPYDHTKDFDPNDISENKAASMLAYLLGPAGILIALLSAGHSAYAGFHIKQAMKLTVAEILGIVILALTSCVLWSIRLRTLVVFIMTVSMGTIALIHLLCFFQVCKGNAIEAYLVRKLKFLN